MIVLLKASQREVTKYVDLLTYLKILTWRLEGPFGTAITQINLMTLKPMHH